MTDAQPCHYYYVYSYGAALHLPDWLTCIGVKRFEWKFVLCCVKLYGRQLIYESDGHGAARLNIFVFFYIHI